MKIRLSDFASSSHSFSVEITQEKLAQAINSTEISPLSPLTGTLTGSFASDGAMLSGTLNLKISQLCGRCVEPKERHVAVIVDAYLRRIPPEKDHEHDGRYEDDVGVFFVKDDFIDISPILEELTVMSLEPYWSPSLVNHSCKLCKKTFNVKTEKESVFKLGDILNKVVKN